MSIHCGRQNSFYSTEFHLKDKKYHYLYIKLYSIGENGEKKPPHIHRLSVFNLQKELVYFYDKNLKSKKFSLTTIQKMET